MKARKTAPTTQTNGMDDQAFRVWWNADHDGSIGDPLPWKCVGMFYFLNEALDYIAQAQDRGATVVFQSPASTREIKPTDQRVVFKGKTA